MKCGSKQYSGFAWQQERQRPAEITSAIRPLRAAPADNRRERPPATEL
jgi:hypothetical protein